MILFFFIYILINLIFLTKYPFVHSDESWLSGLSRTVLDKQSFLTSEPFFDLYPRAIHGLRVVFVFIQILFIKLFGYTIFSVRLVSLLFSTLTLYVAYKIILFFTKNKYISAIGTLIIAFSIQYILMSHTARQESIVLFGMTSAFYLCLIKFRYQNIVIGSIIGILIGVHPNSFLIACGIGMIYLYKYSIKDIEFIDIIKLVFTSFMWALLFIGISIYLNSNALKEYITFGSSLGVFENDISRLKGFGYYYYKLFKQIGGTYYLVNIKADLIITSLILPSLFLIKNKTRVVYPSLMIIGINIGYIIIGRYNQTAIIFTILFAYINLIFLVHFFFKNKSYKVILGILVVLLGYNINNVYTEISQTNYEDYYTVGEKVTRFVPKNSKVLANLNLDYHFDNYSLYDYRNLQYLEDMKFSEYIERNSIEYIILYEEMEYIYNSNSKWDILYGDLEYYDEMMEYVSSECMLVEEFENPTYAMRIAKYIDVYPWYTKIYKTKN